MADITALYANRYFDDEEKRDWNAPPPASPPDYKEALAREHTIVRNRQIIFFDIMRLVICIGITLEVLYYWATDNSLSGLNISPNGLLILSVVYCVFQWIAFYCTAVYGGPVLEEKNLKLSQILNATCLLCSVSCSFCALVVALLGLCVAVDSPYGRYYYC
ncbi:hypothetical protein GLAREA_10128 [Glarea lozoyensis ATCC 20868]|uniref:Uncharacterized protein n=1 Tax=Glarea lozoyensis (strain ATCC 20868 / MF5171) TaxID=1116229 RepID=S3DBE7_GLAL2|nr:uncharacterized protein GLAREA_10128 [Glarea lozoyensis ATCC 20868]EPE34434.1 hypothetical protein GLAREA_10128 [Glarea lozoyensis ATCC 20868]